VTGGAAESDEIAPNRQMTLLTNSRAAGLLYFPERVITERYARHGRGSGFRLALHDRAPSGVAFGVYQERRVRPPASVC
jgi:hypothetical protein